MNKSHPSMPALLTYEDYCQIPNDGNRYEVIDGVLYMSPAPVYRHQRISLKLARILDTFAEEHELGNVLTAPFDIILSDSNIVQPDILFISNERASIITPNNAHGAPDLLIEILSKSNRRYDEVVKKQLYEMHGVQEYWIVDPEEDRVYIYQLEEAVLKHVSTLSVVQEDILTTPILPGFTCDLKWLFNV